MEPPKLTADTPGSAHTHGKIIKREKGIREEHKGNAGQQCQGREPVLPPYSNRNVINESWRNVQK